MWLGCAALFAQGGCTAQMNASRPELKPLPSGGPSSDSRLLNFADLASKSDLIVVGRVELGICVTEAGVPNCGLRIWKSEVIAGHAPKTKFIGAGGQFFDWHRAWFEASLNTEGQKIVFLRCSASGRENHWEMVDPSWGILPVTPSYMQEVAAAASARAFGATPCQQLVSDPSQRL